MNATFPRVTFKTILVSLFLVFTVFCNKSYSPALDPLQNNIVLLTGNTRASAAWKLTNLYIDQVRQPMTAGVNTYNITYNLNGKFQDSDGMEGVWTLETADSLRHKIMNNPGVINPVQGFRILNLTSTDLALSYLVNGQKIQANYTIVK